MPTTRYKTRRVSKASSTRARMPRKSRKVARIYKRRPRLYKTPALRTKWTNPMARSMSTRFTWGDQGFDLTTGAGGIPTAYVLRGNSCYDPNETGVGTQPYGYDNLCNAAMFTDYRVIASKVKWFIYVSEGVGAQNIVCTLFPYRAGVPTYQTTTDLLQIPNVMQKRMSSTSRPQLVMTKYMTTSRMFPEESTKDHDYTGMWNSNPNTEWFWNLWVDSTSLGASKVVQADCEITYYVKLARDDDSTPSSH